MACELVDLDRPGTRMKIIFVRHGEPDYSMLDKLENPQLYSGFGRDFSTIDKKKVAVWQKKLLKLHVLERQRLLFHRL